MKRSYFLFILALALALFTSCEEGVTPINDQVAPTLPPAEMYTAPMTMDGDSSNNHIFGATYRNWFHAGANILVWNTAVALNVAVPLASFGLALNERPVFIGNATFEWSYVYRAPAVQGGKVYDVVLTGQYLNNTRDVEWIMTMSERGGFTNFEWFRGITSTDQTEAAWTLNHKPNNPEPYMSIDYTRNPGNSDESIRYTNINPSNSGMGGYIEYRSESANPFNRAYDVYPGPNNPGTLLEIQWSVPSNEGRVKHESHFNDTDWHCWNSHLQDTAC